ncbi:hypothetical protein HK405_000594, partial [Cladochytrium tenue]
MPPTEVPSTLNRSPTSHSIAGGLASDQNSLAAMDAATPSDLEACGLSPAAAARVSRFFLEGSL